MRQQITLPALQFAAAAFLATSAQAQAQAGTDTFCVDQTSTVVADANCEGANAAAGNFFWAQGPEDAAEGDFIPPVSARNAEGYVSGGFGKRHLWGGGAGTIVSC
ncbi:hypothetical protein F5Y13DRAFT_188509 [Hypoxylon sp. FL1857]|nr:hypothetical protein F5Y13DRAFT_188509 [Hypoxylon sp. FL1857]